jgi:16S rRNA (guanine(966)-N(2))-methyltransferase RsmD
MRIITGKYRGRKVRISRDSRVRPTLDRVKEALFSTLAGRVEGGLFGDFFAGSGNIGIEALSRGAREVVFAEKSVRNRKVIEENCRNILSPEDADKWRMLNEVQSVLPDPEWHWYFDVLFFDPPYPYLEKVIQSEGIALFMKSAMQLVRAGGIFVLEAPDFFYEKLKESEFQADKERKYGHIYLMYYIR